MSKVSALVVRSGNPSLRPRRAPMGASPVYHIPYSDFISITFFDEDDRTIRRCCNFFLHLHLFIDSFTYMLSTNSANSDVNIQAVVLLPQ